MACDFTIRPEQAGDAAAVGALHAAAFGPGRFARSAYRIREASAGPAIALVASDEARLVGSIQLTAITIGGVTGGLLLGPLAIAPDYRNLGCGLTMIEAALQAARSEGARLVVLVGDPPYYARAGFAAVPPGRMALPGPVDPQRLLAYPLVPGAEAAMSGPIAAA